MCAKSSRWPLQALALAQGRNSVVTPIKQLFFSFFWSGSSEILVHSVVRMCAPSVALSERRTSIELPVMASWIFVKRSHQISNQIVWIGIIQIPQRAFPSSFLPFSTSLSLALFHSLFVEKFTLHLFWIEMSYSRAAQTHFNTTISNCLFEKKNFKILIEFWSSLFISLFGAHTHHFYSIMNESIWYYLCADENMKPIRFLARLLRMLRLTAYVFNVYQKQHSEAKV